MKYILLLISPMVCAQTYDYKILRVIDGDTIEFQADFLPAPLDKKLSLRIYGVDTPEKYPRSKCEIEKGLSEDAKDFTESLISKSKSHKIIIKNWDKYGGRVDGDVILDGKSLRASLLEKGFSKLYYGGPKTSWCE